MCAIFALPSHFLLFNAANILRETFTKWQKLWPCYWGLIGENYISEKIYGLKVLVIQCTNATFLLNFVQYRPLPWSILCFRHVPLALIRSKFCTTSVWLFRHFGLIVLKLRSNSVQDRSDSDWETFSARSDGFYKGNLS